MTPMVSRSVRRLLVFLLVAPACGSDQRSSISVGEAGSDPPEPSRPSRPDASCESSIGFEDFDRDGFARSMGDCDDCDPARGPAALDVPLNGLDEDCRDGDAEEVPRCDDALDPEETSIDGALAALGVCPPDVRASAREWGVVEARWLRIDGSEALADPRQVWLPERFGEGVLPREGGRLLVLSTGVARDLSSRAYTPGCDVFTGEPDESGGFTGGVAPPAGFPVPSDRCTSRPFDASAPAYDDVGLALTLRAPLNATGIAFDSMLFTHEYPDLVCAPANDFFVALLDEPPPGSSDGNLLIDPGGDPVGVNSALVSVCTDTLREVGDVECSAGPALLEGTGYGAREASCRPTDVGTDIGGAATGWLRTEVPVRPGSLLELRFLLWDAGDPLVDSTVVIDNLRFLTTPLEAQRAPTDHAAR